VHDPARLTGRPLEMVCKKWIYIQAEGAGEKPEAMSALRTSWFLKDDGKISAAEHKHFVPLAF